MNIKRSPLGILVFALILSINLSAQENIVVSGGESNGTGGTMSYTIGQIDYHEQNGNTGSINEGVQQPYEFYTVGIDNHTSLVVEIKAFPNPTKSVVILSVNQDIQEIFFYALYDTKGSLLKSEKMLSNETTIPLNQLNRGTYLLNVRDNKTTIKTFKIIKN